MLQWSGKPSVTDSCLKHSIQKGHDTNHVNLDLPMSSILPAQLIIEGLWQHNKLGIAACCGSASFQAALLSACSCWLGLFVLNGHLSQFFSLLLLFMRKWSAYAIEGREHLGLLLCLCEYFPSVVSGLWWRGSVNRETFISINREDCNNEF